MLQTYNETNIPKPQVCNVAIQQKYKQYYVDPFQFEEIDQFIRNAGYQTTGHTKCDRD